MERARADHNEEAIRDLQSIAPYAAEGKPIALKALFVQRKWLDHYGGAVTGRRDFSAEGAAVHLSPEYTDTDVARWEEGNEFAERYLLEPVINVDLSKVARLDCPLIIFAGRNDYNVSSTVAAEWFAKVQAPAKRFVWFEHSAHEIMDEEPGRMLMSLVQYARPFAERAGDVPAAERAGR